MNPETHSELRSCSPAPLRAHRSLRDLHALLTCPGRHGMTVGQMIGIAAQMGLLSPRCQEQDLSLASQAVLTP